MRGIFLNQSGSMRSKSDTPTNNKIKHKLNNMLGSSIQAISNFCKIRTEQNFKDKCSLIGFSDKANIIFKDVDIDNNEKIIDDCLSKLVPLDFTNFKKAFEESSKILEEIKRNEFYPIIILLTDGLDHYYEETISFIENVSIYFFTIIILYR